MKNMFELPRESDFHHTTIIESLHGAQYQGQIFKKDDTFMYRKGSINLRNIIDYFEIKLKFTIIDEEKLAEYDQKMQEWKTAVQELTNKNRAQNGLPPMNEFMMGNEEQFSDSPVEIADAHAMVSMPMPVGFPERPKVPVKNIEIEGTQVVYMNSMGRIILEPLDDFKQMYFSYLKKQQLDIVN